MKNVNSSLEICCYSLKSALIAQKAGADRIELCSGMLEGGLTPSIGLIRQVLENTHIPVNFIIRPRGGDFMYNDDDFEVMKADIEEIKKLNPNGFVFGILKEDGSLDIERMQILCELAKPFQITFHRAFDMCVNPELVIQQLIDLGVNIILTSGQKKTAFLGVENLKNYHQIANGKIKIMAGAGVSFKNIEEIKQIAQISDFHLSAKMPQQSLMKYFNDEVKMGDENEDEYKTFEADFDLIQKASLVLKHQN